MLTHTSWGMTSRHVSEQSHSNIYLSRMNKWLVSINLTRTLSNMFRLISDVLDDRDSKNSKFRLMDEKWGGEVLRSEESSEAPGCSWPACWTPRTGDTGRGRPAPGNQETRDILIILICVLIILPFNIPNFAMKQTLTQINISCEFL